MLRIIITGPAKRDIQVAHDWWASNRSVEQAARWYLGIQKAIDSLKKMPSRCALSPERELYEHGIRQPLFDH